MKSPKFIHSLNEKGQVIILLAVGFLAFLAFLGLAVDVTMLYVTQENLQTSVDAAALAAANKLPDQSKAITTAYTYMRLNNYTYDPSSNPLTITFPSLYACPKSDLCQCCINAYPYTFLQLFGWHTTPVSATGEGESAPLDLYLVLDLSSSMVFDTAQPANWALIPVPRFSLWNPVQRLHGPIMPGMTVRVSPNSVTSPTIAILGRSYQTGSLQLY